MLDEKRRWRLTNPEGRQKAATYPSTRSSAHANAKRLIRRYYADDPVRMAIRLAILAKAYEDRGECTVPSLVTGVADYYIYDFS